MTRSAARASVVNEVPGYAAALIPIIPAGPSDRDRPELPIASGNLRLIRRHQRQFKTSYSLFTMPLG